MLTVEQQRQLVGCSENSCMSELAGALGAEHLVSGLIGKLGSTFVLTLKLIDTRTARAAARASRRFQRLDDAAEAVGPLVDELFGKQPQKRPAPPVFRSDRTETPPETPKAPKVPPMTVQSFCDRAESRYVKGLTGNTSVATLTQTRRALLEDLLRTAFVRELERKRTCLESHADALVASLENRQRVSKSARAAQDAERRQIEWARLRRELELVIEAYRIGLEKEKNGTGVRPTALPFKVREPNPPPRGSSESVQRFSAAYPEAQAVIQAALETVNENDKRKFVKFWTKKFAGRRMSPRDTWVEVLRDSDTYDLDPCPLFARKPKEIETDAKKHTSNRILGCVRKISKKDGQATFEPITLQRVRKKWRIGHWKAPPVRR